MADETTKRQGMARRYIAACTNLLAAELELKDLAAEELKLSTDFQDSDFINQTDLVHLTGGQLTAMLQTALGNLSTAIDDSGHGGQIRQLLEQARNT